MNMTLTIILGEICLVLAVALLVIGGKALRHHRRGKAAAKTLVTSIKEKQSARVEKLAGMIKVSGQFNDEDALGKANEFIKKQNKFYQDAIDLFFNRNHDVLSRLDSRIEDLLNQYQTLITAADGDASPVDSIAVERLSKDIMALSKELEGLRAENANLASQLKAAEHELDQLGQEYVSAFNKPKVNKPKMGEAKLHQASREAKHAGTVPAAVKTSKSQGEDERVTKPIAEEAPTENAMAQAANQAQADNETIEGVVISTEDDSEDYTMLRDLDLDELIGDQPGQPGINGKVAENK
jgi:hypothetical protein